MGTRVRCGIAVALTAMALGSAAHAWACIPSSRFWSEPDFAQPGAAARLRGQGFSGSVVEIHWGGPDGPVVATAPAPDFSVDMTVPRTADGVYVLYAVGLGTATLPSSGSWNRTPFEVTASGARGGWGDGGWGQAPAATTSSDPAAPGAVPAVADPVASPAAVDPGPGTVNPTPAGNSTPPPAAGPVQAPRAVAGPTAARSGLTAPTPSRPAPSAAQPSAAPARPAAPGQPILSPGSPATGAQADVAGIAPLPSTSDLWSGLRSSRPSLTSQVPAPASTGPSPVGFGLLGVAGVALLGALAGAARRRRPALARIFTAKR